MEIGSSAGGGAVRVLGRYVVCSAPEEPDEPDSFAYNIEKDGGKKMRRISSF